MSRFCFFLWLFLVSSLGGFGQDTTESRIRILTKDGNEYLGRLVSEDSSAVMLGTDNLGVIRILRTDIRRQEIIPARLRGAGPQWEENRLAGKYFISSSAYNLRKGEGYYQNGLVFYNQATFGLTDNWSISGGTIPLFMFYGESTPVWISTKFSVPVVKNKFNVGAGVLGGVVIGEAVGFGLVYGNATIGSRDRNLTFLAGWAFSDGIVARTPSFSISGMYRTSRRWYLLTENYYFDSGDDKLLLFSMGARYLARNIGIDFGGSVPFLDGSDFLMFPWLGIMVPFGGRKGINR